MKENHDKRNALKQSHIVHVQSVESKKIIVDGDSF